MNRIENILEYIEPKLKEKVLENKEEITKEILKNKEEITNEFINKITNLIRKKESIDEVYIIISPLKSSIITKKYELVLGCYDENLYLDKEAIYDYFHIKYLFKNINKDVEEIKEELKEMAKYINDENNKSEDESNNEETKEEKTDEEKVIEELAEKLEEMLSNEYLVRGALLRCRLGSHERKLNILKDHGLYIGNKPLAHKLDRVEFENIMSFGVCSSKSKYLKTESVLLEKEIIDEKGKVKKQNVRGKACVPCIIETWLDTKKKVRLTDNGEKDPSDKEKDGNDVTKGYELLTMNSFLVCRHGGLIEPLDSGQDLIYEEEPVMKEIEENDIDVEIEGTTEGTTETIDPNRDREVLKGLLDSEGTGINLAENPEKFINYLKEIINESWDIAKDKAEQYTKDAPLGFMVKADIYLNSQKGILQKELRKIMADLYRGQQNGDLDVFSYEQAREIAKLINEVINYNGILYIPTEEQHYFRNVMNDLSRAPENLEDMLKETKEGKWKLLPVGASVYHKQGGGNNMYNLKFVSVDYDENGKELDYGYFEAVYSLENTNDIYTKENPPKGILLDRDTNFINMGTYNYGNDGVSHTFKDVFPYNSINGMGNVGEDTLFLIPNDYELFIRDKLNSLISLEDVQKVYNIHNKIINFIKGIN